MTEIARQRSILDSFPAQARRRLSIEEQSLGNHEALMKANERPEWVYFPQPGCVVSLTRTTEVGTTVEVGIIGFEGVVGIQSVMSPGPIRSDAVVQVSGNASRVPLSELRAVSDDNATVREILQTSCVDFLNQVSQTAICNRIHNLEQRLAKWLLGVRDRAERDSVDLTHDFLSNMLGVRRAGVTVAVGEMELDGLVKHDRARITILDPPGLKARSCECYSAIGESSGRAVNAKPRTRL